MIIFRVFFICTSNCKYESGVLKYIYNKGLLLEMENLNFYFVETTEYMQL